jgi:hypothetical protein
VTYDADALIDTDAAELRAGAVSKPIARDPSSACEHSLFNHAG